MVTHANVTALFAGTRSWLRFGPDDVWTLFHSYAFDFSVWELWGHLLHGGRLVVVPAQVARAPDEILPVCRAGGGDGSSNQTPSAFLALLGLEEVTARPCPPASARGGVRRRGLVPPDPAAVGESERGPPAGDWSICTGSPRRPCTSPTGGWTRRTWRTRRAGSAGRTPEAGGVSVRDGRCGLVPWGRAGGGVGGRGRGGLAGTRGPAGADGRPVLARTRPARPAGGRTGPATGPGTGPAGALDFLGRADGQGEGPRGFRVEPGECGGPPLASHPAVRAAAASRPHRPDRRGGVDGVRRLPRPPPPDPGRAAGGGGGARARARARLAARLPAHLVPARLAVLPALPLTPNGKVDRHALPDADSLLPARSSSNRRGGRSRRRWPGRSPRCWRWSGSAATTDSSTWAGIRCSPCGSSAGSAKRSVWLPPTAPVRVADGGRARGATRTVAYAGGAVGMATEGS